MEDVPLLEATGGIRTCSRQLELPWGVGACAPSRAGTCEEDEEAPADPGCEAWPEDAPDQPNATTGGVSGAKRGHGGGRFECRHTPWQHQARRYYVWLLPFSALQLALMWGPIAVLVRQMCQRWSARTWARVLGVVPVPLLVSCWLLALGGVVMTYVYHFLRLRSSAAAPDFSWHSGPPLTHVVIVCSYKEPAEVLARTFASIAGQRAIRRPPIAVFAAEERDPTWRASFLEIEKVCQGRLQDLFPTEHVLGVGEVAGKSSNENWAAREVFRRLVVDQGADPFEVMVTIVDADSILSPTYLAHVEASFWQQPDGRRLVFSGPLNVYRNFTEAGLLVQCLELARCHQDTFHGLFQVPHPFSNYSLTLGLASEIGFWTPDVMPEDIHTANKAIVNSFGSRVTVTVPSIICNDLVSGLGDRYLQAKRHQYGSVTELAWTVALFWDTDLRFQAWWAAFSAEASRVGSFVGTVGALGCLVLEGSLGAFLAWHRSLLPDRARLILCLLASYVAWEWLWFWIAELALWHTLLRQFPIQRPPLWRWPFLILLMPPMHVVNRLLFLVVPTAHALFHAVAFGELAYVCAPKGGGKKTSCAL